jgi:hypothetical protein
MATDYDVIVLGAGAPGELCASDLAEGGPSLPLRGRHFIDDVAT